MLAQATGFYRERPVGPGLQDHFACAWVHQLPSDGSSPIVVVPDGAIDVQWVGGRWRIAGPDRDPQTETPPAGSTIIGFRFRPAAAATWLGAPVSEFLNQRVWLEDTWRAKARRMADGLERPREPEALMTALEAALARQLRGPTRAVAIWARRSSFFRPGRLPENCWFPGWPDISP